MEAKASFNYKSTKRSYIPFFFLVLLLGLLMSCLATIIFSSFIFILAEKIFSSPPPSYLAWVIFLILVVLSFFRAIQGKLILITVDDQALTWQMAFRKEKKIFRNEIQTSKFDKRGRLIINDLFKINLNGLPQKKGIELSNFILRWLPQTSLAIESQEFLRWRNQLQADWQEGTSFSEIVQTNKHRAKWMQGLILIVIAIFLVLIIWIVNLGELHEAIFPILFMAIPVVFTFLLVWNFTKYKKIEVNDSGLAFTLGKREHFYDWHSIEVLAFRTRSQHLLVWQDSRYKSFSYNRLEAKITNNLLNTIYQQAIIRNIPIAAV